MIKIILVDDHSMMREGLKRIIAYDNDLRVVGELADGANMMKLLETTACDIIILDLNMPKVGGLEVIKQIRGAGYDVPILVLSMHNSADMVEAALRAGANGYLTKDFDPGSFIEIVRKIAGGGRYIDAALATNILFDGVSNKSHREQLSGRELQIIKMIVDGVPIIEIAEILSLNPKTVSTYKRRIMKKLNVENNADLIRTATEVLSLEK